MQNVSSDITLWQIGVNKFRLNIGGTWSTHSANTVLGTVNSAYAPINPDYHAGVGLQGHIISITHDASIKIIKDPYNMNVIYATIEYTRV